MEIVPGLHWVERIWDTKVYLVIEDDRATIVDAATPGRAGAVWSALARLGLAPQAVDAIWLTHGDIDHMGSAAALKAGSGARLVAHEADVPLVEGQADRALGDVALAGSLQRLFNWGIQRLLRYRPVVVDQPVADGARLGDWQVIHTPGHTPGSACFYHGGRGIIIVGDAVNHRHGRLNAPPRIFCPDTAQAQASIRRIAALDFEVCCFGHGPPILAGARQRVQDLADSLSRP